MSQTHILKTIEPHYKYLVSNAKKFEIRENDRGFEVGDYLILAKYDDVKREYDPYHGYQLRRVTHMTDYAQDKNRVVMSVEPVEMTDILTNTCLMLLRYHVESETRVNAKAAVAE